MTETGHQGGRGSARLAAVAVLALLAAVPPVALAATSVSRGGDSAALPGPEQEQPSDSADIGRPRRGKSPVPSVSAGSSPSALASPSTPSASGQPSEPATVAVDPGLQQRAASWVSANVPGRVSVLAAGSTAERMQGRSLVVETARPGVRPEGSGATLIIDDPALRAAAGVGDRGFPSLPLVARFGSGPGRIDVRRRAPRPDTMGSTRAFLADDTVVGTEPAARDAALAAGLDARLLAGLRGFTAGGQNLLSTIQAFPASGPEIAARAPRRVAEVRAINGYNGASSMFDVEAQKLRRHLMSLPAGSRPQYAGVEQRPGTRVFVIRYAVGVQ